MDIGQLVAPGILGLVAIIGWFLRQKDEQQGTAIALLFKKHDDDAAALGALRLEIAKEHYLKHELDARFVSLENTFKQGMHDLGTKFDKLSDILIRHVTEEDKGR
jgi:hypothetical protein